MATGSEETKMSVPNQEYTEHLYGHDTPHKNCEGCAEQMPKKTNFMDIANMSLQQLVDSFRKN